MRLSPPPWLAWLLLATLTVEADAQSQEPATDPPSGSNPSVAAKPATQSVPDGEDSAAFPLVPRFETPSVTAKRQKQKAFLTPTDKQKRKKAKTLSAESTEPDAAESIEPDDFPGYSPGIFPRVSGYYRDFAGESFLSRPRSSASQLSAEGEPQKAVLYTRGLFTHLSRGHDPWTATELIAHLHFAERFNVGAVFHHEYRESTGTFGMISLVGVLASKLSIVSSIGIGNGADFLPINTTHIELRGKTPIDDLHYAGGGGTSTWSRERQDYFGTAAIMYGLRGQIAIELRGKAQRLTLPGINSRGYVGGHIAIAYRTAQSHSYEIRVGGGTLPGLSTQATLHDTVDHPYWDASAAHRWWIGDDYGLIVELDYGGQHGEYQRFGGGLAVFSEL